MTELKKVLERLTELASEPGYKGNRAEPKRLRRRAKSLGASHADVVRAIQAGKASLPGGGNTRRWGVAVDESGSVLRAGGDRDCVVAVAFEATTEIPDRSDYHAAMRPIAERISVLNEAMNRNPIVLGLLADHPVEHTDAGWGRSVAEVLQWMVALTPMDPRDECRQELVCYVEERSGAKAGTSPLSLRGDLERVASAIGTDQQRLAIGEVKVVGKGVVRASGYADVIANLWFTGSDEALGAMRKRGLLNSHLIQLNHSEREKRRVCRDTPESCSAELWTEAMASWHEDDDVITAYALKRLAQVASTNPAVWRQWWTASESYRDQKETDARVYERMVRWLTWHVPPGLEVDAHTALSIECSQLTADNHQGRAAEEVDRRLEAAIKAAPPGRAALMILGVLTRAVYRTNRFEFDAAAAVVEPWREFVDDTRYVAASTRGRLYSQWGQIRAMQGHAVEAIESFEQALGEFDQIDPAAERHREQSQTATYLVHALLDAPSVPADALREALDELAAALGETVDSMAGSTSLAHRFAVHAITRCAVLRPDVVDPSIVITDRAAWDGGDHHPWPLIRMYRGLLTFGVLPEAARRCFADAVTDARSDDMGPILWFIAEAIAAVGQRVGMHPGPDASRVEQVVARLPATAPRAQILLNPPSDLSPVDLVSAILPFGFR